MSETISIPNPWVAPSKALPAEVRENAPCPRDWPEARYRMGLYLEALAVPSDVGKPLIDQAIALTESRRPGAADSALAMAALFELLTEHEALAGYAMNDNLGPAFFFHRSMLPGDRATLGLKRGHMVPTVPAPANHKSLRGATSEWLEKMTEPHPELHPVNQV